MTAFAKYRQFSRQFWFINIVELLERGAYYSLAPVLTIFMNGLFRETMGVAEAATLAGILTAVNYFLLYAVPVFAAALAEKFGYRAALIASFVLLVAGYAITLVAGTVALVLTAVVLIGFGAGVFKPIVAAIVTKTTTNDQRNAGFAIYYGCINLGAFIFPTAVAIVTAVLFPERLFAVAFGTATLLNVVNLALVLGFYRNVDAPRSDVSVLKAFAALGDVFRYKSFLLLLVIYSGFWFMYGLNLAFLPQYMVDFARMPTWFAPTLIMSINAFVIILGAPLIAPMTDRFRSLTLMTVGIGGYALSLLVFGWFSPISFFIGGIILFSFFELVTHPSYLAYVSKISPPDKVAIYFGYGFLPIAVGLTLGSLVGGALYGNIALEAGKPELFWSIIASVGLAAAALLLLYNAVLTSMRERDEGTAKPRRRGVGWLAGPGVAIAIVLLIPAVVMGAGMVTPTTPTGVEPLSADLRMIELDPVDDLTREGQTSRVAFDIPEEATGAALVVLAWSDEQAQPGATNQADTFRLHVVLEDGTRISSDFENDGRIELPLDAIPGAHTIEVEMVEAGDQTIGMGPLQLPVPAQADTGNAWTLERAYESP